MRCFLIVLLVGMATLFAKAQTPKAFNAAEILAGIQKLKVLGSVLYIAAHPDDENTSLLAYFSKERMYRTGYLSLTRGDGGQNLIGNEQGAELGLIRTQELLAARSIDGAEQFFTRAFDFGYSKNTQESLQIWNKEKILSDVVWIIRKFRPDIIITRFPPDSRAGHGQHSASAVLAQEAFYAAADTNRYPEHFVAGVGTWQTKRIFWNTYKFGNNNTTSNDQLKLDVGLFNHLLGKSYGEIAAASRSMHKSQGFGVPAQRGELIEFFTQTGGDEVKLDLFEGITTDWNKYDSGAIINEMIHDISSTFSPIHPSASVYKLVQLYNVVKKLKQDSWTIYKLAEIKQLIEACTGLWLEASTNQEYVVKGNKLTIHIQALKRTNTNIVLKRIQLDSNNVTNLSVPNSSKVHILQTEQVEKEEGFIDTMFNKTLVANQPINFSSTIIVNRSPSQPYWLTKPTSKGAYNVDNQLLIGLAENTPVYMIKFSLQILETEFVFEKPVQYKFTDAVQGELYQKLMVYPPAFFKAAQPLLLFKNQTNTKKSSFQFLPQSSYTNIRSMSLSVSDGWIMSPQKNQFHLPENQNYELKVEVRPENISKQQVTYLQPSYPCNKVTGYNQNQLRKIVYNHIPSITYFPEAITTLVKVDVKTVGKKIGYIDGAGDFIPQSLQQLGYEVVYLNEKDVTIKNLNQFDAVVTGIRAYNIHPWLSNAHSVLMKYVKEGGVLLLQYNTNNFISTLVANMSPYPFKISRNRVTEEDAKVRFLVPNHPVCNYPNKITENDFTGWVQERSVYEAEDIDPKYESIFGINDSDEPQQNGSLIVANYGKGRFIYSALAFFRQLPAGVPGAYRLFANLLARPVKNISKKTIQQH